MRIIEPKMIVGLGKVVGRSLINKNLSMDLMRDKVYIFLLSFKNYIWSEHFVTRTVIEKLAWEDFQFVRVHK